MEQGSSQWLEFRRRRLGASDAAIIMGVSPWSTPYQLWMEKTGQNEKPDSEKKSGTFPNWAIERGVRWEPMARARYELHNDVSMEPAVLIHKEFDWLIASLDGWNEGKRRVLEIKIPGKEVFELAKNGEVHEKYVWQLEQQLLVAQADEAHFYCCKVEKRDGREQIVDDALVIYKSNPERREKLIPKLHEFWGYVVRNEPPPLESRDYMVLKNENYQKEFDRLEIVIREHDEAEEALDLAEKRYNDLDDELKKLKDKIIPLFAHPRVKIGNVMAYEKRLKNNKKTWHFKLAQ